MNLVEKLQSDCEKLPGFFEFAMECFNRNVEITKLICEKYSLDPRLVYERLQNPKEDPEIMRFSLEVTKDNGINKVQPK
jgi:hypothetical protein